MREHYYRTQPARIHDGIPDAPKWFKKGASFLTVDDARLVSVTHAVGTGRIHIHVVSESGNAFRFPAEPPQASEARRVEPETPVVPDHLPNGVRFSFVAHSAMEIAASLRSVEAGDETRFVAPPAEAPLDVGEVPSFFIVKMHEDDSVWLFLRSWDQPFATRIHLVEKDKELLWSSLTGLLAKLKPQEWDAYVTPLDVPCIVGPQPEARAPGVDTSPSDPPVRAPLPPPPPRLRDLVKGAISRFLG